MFSQPLLFLHPAPRERKKHTPLHSMFPPLCLTIQSEAGGDFLGVVAEPIVARLLPRCIPLPHLYTLPHTPSRPAALSLLPQLINYSAFCQDTCMRVHSNPPTGRTVYTHTHAQIKVLMQRFRAVGAWAALSSGRTRRRHQIGLLQNGALPPFFINHRSSRLHCSVTGTVFRMCLPCSGKGWDEGGSQNWRKGDFFACQLKLFRQMQWLL